MSNKIGNIAIQATVGTEKFVKGVRGVREGLRQLKGSRKKGVIVTGVPEIDRKLRRLEYKTQRKIVVDAMKRGLDPLLNEVKANAPVDTGDMKKNIKIRAGKSRKGVVKREVRVGDKQMGANFHAQHVEFGTSQAPPHPFMGPAFESHGPNARDRIEREILAGVMQEVAN